MRIDKANLEVFRAMPKPKACRPNLEGVRIDGNQTIGTDGHILAVVKTLSSDSDLTPCVIGADSVKALQLACKQAKGE